MRMNRSDLALASFVDRYECDPTFRPVILGVRRQELFRTMAKSKRKIARLPRIEFSFGCPPITQSELRPIADRLNLPPEYRRTIKWENGGYPKPAYFDWTHPRDGKRTSRIYSIFGINAGPHDERFSDCVSCIMQFRMYMPRWAIPVGWVDEDSWLITYPTTHEFEDQIWYKYWCHEHSDLDPEDDVFFIAQSLPHLLNSLYDIGDE
jgi:hypothetical protein